MMPASTLQLHKSTFAIKNSSTIILPKWFLVLSDLNLDSCIMPRDVQTHWNLTFDMLHFAIEYCEALDAMTGDRDMKLRQYELSEEDWNIATQLCDVLKVSFICKSIYYSKSLPCRFLKMQCFTFHEAHHASLLSSQQWTTLTNISQRL